MLSFSFWEAILIYACINAVLALGLYVTVTSGMMSIAHAAAAGMSAYASAILTTNFDMPFVVAILAGMAVGYFTGYMLAAISSRLSLLVSSIVTLAFGESVSIIAYNIDYLGGANSFMGIPLYTTLPISFGALLITMYVVNRFERSREGYAARATRNDPKAAAASGIDVLRVRRVAFSLGAAISALAGALEAHYTLVVSPKDLGFWPSFYIQVYVIFGGSYTMWGPILGAAILTPMEEMLRFAGGYRFAVYGLVILLVLILRPRGLLERVPYGDTSRLRRLLAQRIEAIRGHRRSPGLPRSNG